MIAVERVPTGWGGLEWPALPVLSRRICWALPRPASQRQASFALHGAVGYRHLPALGYLHKPVNLSASIDPAHVELPGVHLVAWLVKRWVAETLHYRISVKHFDYYLDEFTFRFNRRTARTPGLLSYRLLQQAAATDPHPLTTLIDSRGENVGFT
jgi:hypothetical protein